MKNLIALARRILYWILPPSIIYLIFRRIDSNRLIDIAFNATLAPIFIGVILTGLVVAGGGVRWHLLLRHYEFASYSFVRSVVTYWASLAIGLLVPGSLGSDAYRVMILGRQRGYYIRGALVIGIEKLAALLACILLITNLYPVLTPNHLPSAVGQVVGVLHVILVCVIAILLIGVLVRRHRLGRRVAETFFAYLEGLAHGAVRRASVAMTQEETAQRGGLSLMLSAFSPRVVLPSILLSLLMLFISATQSQMFFHGLGYEIPFLVNLFITPLLFLLFTLPISFGGIGVREGAYIILYGAFGVPAEIALAASVCSLFSVLLSYCVGAALYLPKGRWQSLDGRQPSV